MPLKSLYETIHPQFAMLVRNFPDEQRLQEFLEAVPIPETKETWLESSRAIAEMLQAAPSVEFAVAELRADEEGTRAFYQLAMTQFPALRENHMARSVGIRQEDQPFYELGMWILSVINRISKQDSEA